MTAKRGRPRNAAKNADATVAIDMDLFLAHRLLECGRDYEFVALKTGWPADLIRRWDKIGRPFRTKIFSPEINTDEESLGTIELG
jgi:hypothetical protein